MRVPEYNKGNFKRPLAESNLSPSQTTQSRGSATEAIATTDDYDKEEEAIEAAKEVNSAKELPPTHGEKARGNRGGGIMNVAVKKCNLEPQHFYFTVEDQ